uniref:Uncharacterized protein n=1 Tax=Arundo donax TaxID=35708 RepID=A0A0A9CLY0_ARUDO
MDTANSSIVSTIAINWKYVKFLPIYLTVYIRHYWIISSGLIMFFVVNMVKHLKWFE